MIEEEVDLENEMEKGTSSIKWKFVKCNLLFWIGKIDEANQKSEWIHFMNFEL